MGCTMPFRSFAFAFAFAFVRSMHSKKNTCSDLQHQKHSGNTTKTPKIIEISRSRIGNKVKSLPKPLGTRPPVVFFPNPYQKLSIEQTPVAFRVTLCLSLCPLPFGCSRPLTFLSIPWKVAEVGKVVYC